MTTDELKALVALFMCSDPWPLSEKERQIVEELLNKESFYHGFADWIDAYHKL